MFEKEAEDWVMKQMVVCVQEQIPYFDFSKQAFQQGAEYGYNLGYRKAMTINNEIEQAEKDKDEWHYEGLPDKTHSSCLIFIKRLPQVRIAFWNCKVWKETLTDDIHDKDEVKAWRYLDFPKENE